MTADLKEKLAKLKEKHAPKAKTEPAPAEDKAAEIAAMEATLAKLREEASDASVEKVEPENDPVKDRLAKLREKAQPKAEYDAKKAKTETPPEEKPKRGRPKKDPSQIDTLYIRCLPAESDVTPIETFVSPILRHIEEDTGVHWGLVEFAKGRALICAHLESLEELPKRLFVDPRTPLGSVVLEVLIPRAREVVRATA